MVVSFSRLAPHAPVQSVVQTSSPTMQQWAIMRDAKTQLLWLIPFYGDPVTQDIHTKVYHPYIFPKNQSMLHSHRWEKMRRVPLNVYCTHFNQ